MLLGFSRLGFAVLALLAGVFPGTSEAARLFASCVRDSGGIVCDLRSDEALAIQDVGTFAAGQPLAGAQFERYNPATRTSAWYFLIQHTSHPQDASRAVERLVRHEGRRNYAVGSFADKLEERATFGASDSEIRRIKDLLSVNREGRTNLFLSVSDALTRLTETRADRRALVLFADGTSSNTEFRDKAVRTALDNNILVFGIHMGRSGQAIAVRSLVDEVRGHYQEAVACNRSRTPARCTDFELTDQFAAGLLGLLENGGTVRLPASAAAAGSELAFRVTYADGSLATAERVVVRQAGVPSAPSETPSGPSPTLSPGGGGTAAGQQTDWGQLILNNVPAVVRPYVPAWVNANPVVTAAGLFSFLALLLLSLLVLAFGRRKPPEPAAAALVPSQLQADAPDYASAPPSWPKNDFGHQEVPATKRADGTEVSPEHAVAAAADTTIYARPPDAIRPVLAALQFLDAKSTRVPIDTSSVRIGRHPDNDIRLDNLTVHRHHAVLHQTPPSTRFTIRDLDTKNGIKVNGTTCRHHVLANGDLVELGEVRFRFHQTGPQG